MGDGDGGQSGRPVDDGPDIDLTDINALIEASSPSTRATLREFHRLLNVVLSSQTVREDPICSALVDRMLLAPNMEVLVPHLEALTERLSDISVEKTGTAGVRPSVRVSSTRADISGAEGLDEDRPRRTMLRL